MLDEGHFYDFYPKNLLVSNSCESVNNNIIIAGPAVWFINPLNPFYPFNPFNFEGSGSRGMDHCMHLKRLLPEGLRQNIQYMT
jgi:hypothetical protein